MVDPMNDPSMSARRRRRRRRRRSRGRDSRRRSRRGARASWSCARCALDARASAALACARHERRDVTRSRTFACPPFAVGRRGPTRIDDARTRGEAKTTRRAKREAPNARSERRGASEDSRWQSMTATTALTRATARRRTRREGRRRGAGESRRRGPRRSTRCARARGRGGCACERRRRT